MKEIAAGFMKTGVASILSTIFSMVSTKIFAVIVGPSGVGLYSLLKQIMLFAMTFGTAGGQSALIQGMASKTGDAKDQYQITVFQIFLICTFAIVLILMLFSGDIAKYSFGSEWIDKIILVKWLVVPVVLTVLFVYLGGVLNSYKAINSLALGQICAAAASVVLAYPVAYQVSRYNSTIAFVWYIAATTAVTVIIYGAIAFKNGWLLPLRKLFLVRMDISSARHFFSISSVTLITGLAASGGLLFVKALNVKTGGLGYAGLFDVSWTISLIYLSLVLNSFMTYYLPKLSETSLQEERCSLINDVMRFCIIIMVPIIVSLVVFKPLLVTFGYSDKFLDSLSIMRWMLVGDYFKVTAWVFSVSVLAKAEMKVLFLSDMLWWSGFVATVSLIDTFDLGLQFIGFSYALLYFMYMAGFFIRAIKQKDFYPHGSVMISWFIGLIIIVLSSFMTWDLQSVNFISSSLLVLIAFVASYLAMHRAERVYMYSLIKRLVKHE